MENLKSQDSQLYEEGSTVALSNDDIKRYSRQLILPEIGPNGQRLLKVSSVLIVGCGGLGCPAAIYLAAAGIGKLGLLDYDIIEKSNLHRQILHREDAVGSSKCASVEQSIKGLNCSVQTVCHNTLLLSENALDIVSKYDVVLDCTDNVSTRYLLNDSCVLAKKPLVSGSALRFEGQLIVYNYKDGPCYRCLFPRPPPPDAVTNCSDGGVLGAVPGIIGTLQALETVKLIIGAGECLVKRLLIFDGLSMSFRTLKLRERKKHCVVCGDNPTITVLEDYAQFCGSAASDKDKSLSLLNSNQRLTPLKYKEMLTACVPHILVDVRQPIELQICGLPNAINFPIVEFECDNFKEKIEKVAGEQSTTNIICICRRGNDSQRAVLKLLSVLPGNFVVKDIIGGLTNWAKCVDHSFPVY